MRLGRFDVIVMTLSAVAGSTLVAWIAGRAGNAAPGAAAGAMIGAGLAYGVGLGHIGPTTIGALIGAVIFVVIGPSFDDDNGIGSIEGAVIGGLMAWLIFDREGRPPVKPVDAQGRKDTA